jgi:hypothetical protein
MRPILLLALAATLSCADPALETLVMKDGRALIGIVTPKGLHGARVALLEPKGAVVEVSLDDVQAREPYARGPEIPVPMEKPKAVDPAAGRRTKLEDLDARVSAAEHQIDEARALLAAARSERQAVMESLSSDFVVHGDIAGVAISLEPGATGAQAERGQRALRLNMLLGRVQHYREYHAANPKSNDLGLQLLDAEFWQLYREFKGPVPF